jgi:hypothetical protein
MPLPFWLTATMSHTSIWFEILFTVLVVRVGVSRRVRLGLCAGWVLFLLLAWLVVHSGGDRVPAHARVFLCVGWGFVFLRLVLGRWMRTLALVFGVCFHMGIWLMIEVGWFSFYTISLYGVWVPEAFWEKLDRVQEALAA